MSLDVKIRLISIAIAVLITGVIMKIVIVPAKQEVCKKVYIEACSREHPSRVCYDRLIESEVCN